MQGKISPSVLNQNFLQERLELMPFSPDIMRVLLLICLLGMAVLAALFLRQRSLSLSAYLGWGLLIVLLPLLGPFLVLLSRPGKQRSSSL